MLGCACAVSGVSPETAIRLHHDLSKAREAMVLATPLHLLYLASPSHDSRPPLLLPCIHQLIVSKYVSSQVTSSPESQLRPHEIKVFAADTLSLLPPLEQRVAELVGVPPWGKMSLATFRPTADQVRGLKLCT